MEKKEKPTFEIKSGGTVYVDQDEKVTEPKKVKKEEDHAIEKTKSGSRSRN